MSEPLMPEPWVVVENRRETPDTVTLVLEPGAGASPKSFRPGQFNMLYAFGVGEVPISISGDARDEGRLVHTIRGVGAVTNALCAASPGDLLGLRGPFGTHWPIAEETGCDAVIAAGGIGLAPLRPVIYHVLAQREAYDDVVLLYGARQPEDLLFTDEFEGWRAAGIQVETTVDNAGPDWTGHVGVVTTLIRRAKFDSPEAAAFICGPEVMMRFMAAELEHQSVVSDRIFVSMERNMQCAVATCGHCQLGSELLCRDGPVYPWPRMEPLITVREL